MPTSGIGTIIPSLPNAQSVNQAFQYDNLDRLTSFIPGVPSATTAATGLALLPKEDFTYDAIGNRTSRTTLAPGALAGNAQTATYAYPNLATTSGTKRHILNAISGANAWTYAYDASGNTIAEGSNVANAATTQFLSAYDAKNRLNKTQIGSSVTDAVTYKINAFGQRVQKTGSGIYAFNAATASSFQFNARYMYDESGNLIGEYAPDGKLIAETVWFNGMPIATLRPKGSNSGTPLGIAGTGAATANNTGANTAANPVNVDIYYLHPDHLGTPRAMTRSTAQAGATTGPNAVNKAVWMWNSDPFGTTGATQAGGSANSAPNKNPQLVTGTAAQIAAASFEQNLRMPGQIEDQETKKFYNYFRDLDPFLGRYLQSDPIGLAGGLSTFGYVMAQPSRKTDQFGLASYRCSIPFPYKVGGLTLTLYHAFICVNGMCSGSGPANADGTGDNTWKDDTGLLKAPSTGCVRLDTYCFTEAQFDACMISEASVGNPGPSLGKYSALFNSCQTSSNAAVLDCTLKAQAACLNKKCKQ